MLIQEIDVYGVSRHFINYINFINFINKVMKSCLLYWHIFRQIGRNHILLHKMLNVPSPPRVRPREAGFLGSRQEAGLRRPLILRDPFPSKQPLAAVNLKGLPPRCVQPGFGPKVGLFYMLRVQRQIHLRASTQVLC